MEADKHFATVAQTLLETGEIILHSSQLFAFK